MTDSILKQDPNTQKVIKETLINRQYKTCEFSG